jgi:hypothetical protein
LFYYGLRHSHASVLLGCGASIGASIKAVSSRLGHANGAIILSTYTHLCPAPTKDAARTIDTLLSGSKLVAKPAMTGLCFALRQMEIHRSESISSKRVQ